MSLDRGERDALSHAIKTATVKIRKRLNDIENAVADVEQAPHTIGVKDLDVWIGVTAVPWHPMLLELFAWYWNNYPGMIVVTSAFREGRRIHGTNPLRAFDLRSWGFPNPRILEEQVNRVWDYGKAPYKVCMFHRKVLCLGCGTSVQNIDPVVGIISSTQCPGCGGRNLKDKGPHLHNQVGDKTRILEN